MLAVSQEQGPFAAGLRRAALVRRTGGNSDRQAEAATGGKP